MNTSNKSQYEYIVGIDFGHGETSAACCPVEWGTPLKELAKPVDIELENNKKAIPSAICILANGDVAIGSEAFLPERLKQAKVHVCFKKAPVSIDGEDEQLMIYFMREVYLRIKKKLSAILSEGNHLVYIATPSGWDQRKKELYQEMAEKAGIPVGGVTTESRAALIRAKTDAATGVTKVVDKGAIVFDLGSSTLDFTYMCGTERPTDYGYDYGASRIEKLIYQQNSDNEDIKYFEDKYPFLIPALLFKARQIKEEVYNTKGSRVKLTVNFEDMIDDEELEDKKCRFKFEQGELNQLLEEKGYMKDLESAMYDFHQQHIKDAPIYGVFLTGGAARMDFVIPLIMKTWNLQENQIFRDQEPSLSISRGVAEVARSDIRTVDAEKSLGKDINNLLKEQPVYDFFAKEFFQSLYENLSASIYDNSVTSLRENRVNNVAQLEKNIDSGIKKTLKQANSNAPHILNSILKEYTSGIQSDIQEIVNHYSNEKISLEIGNISLEKFNVNFNLQNELSSLLNDIMPKGGGWGDIFLGAGAGALAAILFGGPVGWIVGGSALLGKAFLGKEKSEEEKKMDAYNKVLSQEQLIKMADKIEEQWNEIDNRVLESVNSVDDTTMRNKITNETRKILTEYVQDCITKARREIK